MEYFKGMVIQGSAGLNLRENSDFLCESQCINHSKYLSACENSYTVIQCERCLHFSGKVGVALLGCIMGIQIQYFWSLSHTRS